jgi:hypothetical protein
MSREHLHAILTAAREVTPEPPRPLTRKLPPADPFPVTALGDLLAPAALAIHDRVQAPIAICGQSVLAAATLAVQPHADVMLPTGHAKPLTIFFMTVAATGERKTAVDTEALWPVRKREAELRQIYDVDLLIYGNEKLAWDKAREAATKNAKADTARIRAALEALGPEPIPPLHPLLTCSEPTYEGLCKPPWDGQISASLLPRAGSSLAATACRMTPSCVPRAACPRPGTASPSNASAAAMV